MEIETGALAVVRALREAGFQALFAGGCVRDLLLGKPTKDWDIATDAAPNAVMRLFPGSAAVGAHFGVVLVRVGKHQYEVARFRRDGVYKDGRRPEAVEFAGAEEDAGRRDFTVNGIFLDPSPGR